MDKKKKKKKKRSLKRTIISDILLLACVCILLYPIITDIWNARYNRTLFKQTQEAVEQLDPNQYKKIYEDAVKYNKDIEPRGNSRFNMSEAEEKRYLSLLKVDASDVIGYLSIPKIGVEYMPIYHTTSQAVLQAGVGHYEGSSLPIGGKGTHTVLSGHTGMMGNKMFSELSKLELGDVFQIYILDKVLYYEVDDMQKLLPDNLSTLGIEPGKDYATLITCIPVGLNSHRLLVRGHRIASPQEASVVHKEDNIFEKIWSALTARFAVYEIIMTMIALLILGLFIIPDIIFIVKRRKKNKDKKKETMG